MKPYRIKDWEKHFENNRSKEIKHLQWVPVPIKLDGDGYLQIMAEPDGPALFGCWIAMIELAGKSQVRGTFLRDDGTARDHASFARTLKMPLDLVERALFFFTETLEWIEGAVIPQEGAVNVRQGCGDFPIEEKGIEQQGSEGKDRTEKGIIEQQERASPKTHSPRKADSKRVDVTPECREVLDYLQIATDSPRQQNLPGNIGKRLAAGHGTVADCKLVIDWWGAMAKAGPSPSGWNAADWFDANTPFKEGTFGANLQKAAKWDADGRPSAIRASGARAQQSNAQRVKTDMTPENFGDGL